VEVAPEQRASIETMKKKIKEEEQDELTEYLVRDRGYGQGDVRINTFIELSEDIYSLGFVTQLKDDIMVQYYDVMKGELINLGGKNESSDSDSEDEKEDKGKKFVSSLNSNSSSKKEVEVDIYTQEIEEQKLVKIEQRNFEIRHQKRLNIIVHVFLTFLF
jgi:hypothetical protein